MASANHFSQSMPLCHLQPVQLSLHCMLECLAPAATKPSKHFQAIHASCLVTLACRLARQLSVCSFNAEHADNARTNADRDLYHLGPASLKADGFHSQMQVNEDIQSSIPLLSETGPIGIPVSCLIKRAVLTVMPQVSCLLSERRTQTHCQGQHNVPGSESHQHRFSGLAYIHLQCECHMNMGCCRA